MDKYEIKKHLKFGDIKLLADKCGVTRKTIDNIINGVYENERISTIINAFALNRKRELENILSDLETPTNK